MKILFTGGGTGGHFYPIIAIAEEVSDIVKEHKVANLELYYMSPMPYNAGILFDHHISYKRNYAGKLRRYFSILNFLDLFKTFWGVIKSVWDVYLIYPDVVFGKGGYASFPALFAARILRIPVVIHESDAVPGRTNLWAGKFAERIALSFSEAAQYFKVESKIAYTGQPIRKELSMPRSSTGHAFLGLEADLPVILVLGGSLGARKVNDVILEALPLLVEKYQVIHQTGKDNFDEIRETAKVILEASPNRNRYRPYAYLDSLTLRAAAGVASLVISRAGSTLFEIALWGLPSIVVPISEAVSHDQVKNAFAYARSGAAVVVEETNLTGNILAAEISRILGSPEIAGKMKASAREFVRPDAARKIAEELLKIALSHEV
ncbi:UDP-N-acetylglucosamine--N-acetylmuramyl-(pentapeptide) pyrophosphoryl-undecaprenol N-acetylglucosamine transferase [Patescibacteria group bacterium]|nr:MAG: UDP-N-acetylglucosamine--N-acetylmuramyl-(pentapeptide) pyrophosphoryl-undecaprenol N-acetylglucosamine transferase [Patescibacteria group bacterium]